MIAIQGRKDTTYQTEKIEIERNMEEDEDSNRSDQVSTEQPVIQRISNDSISN